MVFITACWKKLTELGRGLLLALMLLSGPVSAAVVEVTAAQLEAVEDGFVLSADFAFELNQRLEDAVNKGLVLHFLVEFELTKTRWYWFDDKLLNRQMHLRLSYHALTRQFRVSTGGLHQSFPTLGEALRVLSRVRYWQVIDRQAMEGSGLKAGGHYLAAVRMKLDVSQLPKPFQIAAVGSRDWTLASEWKLWEFSLPVGEGR